MMRGAKLSVNSILNGSLEKRTLAVKKEFFDTYEDHLREFKTLESDQVHQDILEAMEERLSDGVDIHHAVKRAVPKHKHEFEGLFRELDQERRRRKRNGRKLKIPIPAPSCSPIDK